MFSFKKCFHPCVRYCVREETEKKKESKTETHRLSATATSNANQIRTPSVSHFPTGLLYNITLPSAQRHVDNFEDDVCFVTSNLCNLINKCLCFPLRNDLPDWRPDGGCRKTRCKRNDSSGGLACCSEELVVVVVAPAPDGFLPVSGRPRFRPQRR